MKTIEIKGSVRPTQGKVSSRTIRNAGNVPCEVYGKENLHIQIDARELGKVVYSPEVFKVNLQIDGKSYDTVMREIQFHPVSDKIVHVDFEQVDDTKVFNIDIPGWNIDMIKIAQDSLERATFCTDFTYF